MLRSSYFYEIEFDKFYESKPGEPPVEMYISMVRLNFI